MVGGNSGQGCLGSTGRASIEREQRWVAVAFTWQGLRALGVDEPSLATFPDEFRLGMVARAEVLGDTGRNSPDKWIGGLASPDLHAIAILFARNAAERERVTRDHQAFLARSSGVEVLSSLDLDGIPPFEYASISAIGIGSLSHKSKEAEYSRRPARARL